MADEKVSFKLDLDAKDAVGALNNVYQKINEIGDSKGIQDLVGSFTSLAGPILVAGTALFGFKKAFDFSLEGEQLLRIENQFQKMAETAGVSSQQILDGIEKATKGTIDQSDAMELATDSILKLGSAASKIPEIMELARKAAMATGGDTAQAFEQLNFAIATGNTRILKRMGLSYDAQDAEKKYALSIGKLNNELTDQEKIQARLNALLDVGNKKLKDSADNAQPLADSIARMKNAFHDLYETTVKFFAQNFAGGFSAMAESAAEFVKTITGDKRQEIKNLEKDIQKARDAWFEFYQIANKKTEDKTWTDKISDFVRGGAENSAKVAAAQMTLAGQKVDELEAKLKSLKGEAETAETPAAATEQDTSKNAAKIANNLRFQKELQQMTESRVAAELEVETNADNYNALLEEKRALLVQSYALKIQEIRKAAKDNETINETQAAQLIEQAEAEKQAKLKQYDQELNDKRLQMYQNQLRAAQDTASGIQAAFGAAAAQATKDMNDYGKRGQLVFNAINGGAQNFFKGLGSGSKSAGDLMKGFLFGAIADVAEAQGQFLLASGIGTFNPVQIAEGGALIALSGLLRSQAGGAGGGVGGGGEGGGAGAGGFSPSIDRSKPEAEQGPKKSVNIQFMGDYLETEQTQKRLVDLIRRETDATEYKYEQIPVR